MDGTRSVHSVKPKTTHEEPLGPRPLPRENKSQAVEPLTPLHRLARFKAIRDKNLKRPAPPVHLQKFTRARSSVDFSGNFARPAPPVNLNLPHQPVKMAAHVNGVAEVENHPVKNKSAEKLTNGKDNVHTNGVDQAKSTNGLDPEPVTAKQNSVQAKVKQQNSPKEEANVEPQLAEVSDQNEQPNDDGEAVVEVDAQEKESVSDGDQGSEGSSLDVVGESSSVESLDLQLSGGVEPAAEAVSDPEPSSTSETVKPPTPEIVRRFRVGGEIKCRPKRTFHSPQLKRKLDGDEDDDESGGKRARDDGTAGSPGWQFFSPSRIVNRLWSPSKASTGEPESLLSDDSMAVNYDDRSRYYDVVSEPRLSQAEEVLEDPPKPAHRWCSLM